MGIRTVALAGGSAAAVGLRLALSAGTGPTSRVGGSVFAAALIGLSLAGGLSLRWPRWSSLAAGVGGAAVLCLGPVIARLGGGLVPLGPAAAEWAPWAATVVLIAVAEEAVLRGTLFDHLLAMDAPPAGAVAVTAALFALGHVPLYGWGVVPLDAAVGVWLGGLRLATQSVTAPATAHALADLAAWWLR